ncbi:amino acid ABC transporter permease [Duodenibacillus massiliensis]|uniref:amino acid ABC transporter permease n=1 Tax=Duodenibacillus massiliensis TaxID=1852381 RepID=UPI00307EABA3
MQVSGYEVLLNVDNVRRLLEGLLMTLNVSLVSVALSLPLGVLFGMVMRINNPVTKIASRTYLEFIRIMPQLVLLFVVYFGFTRSFGWNLSAYTSSIIVFTAWGTAEMGDLVRGALGSIPRYQYESAHVLGLSPLQTYRFVIIPQTLQRLVPPAINLVTRMIKTTSLVVLIGLVEVLKVGQQIIDANRFQFPTVALWIYAAVFLLYFFACWPITLAAGHFEKKWSRS